MKPFITLFLLLTLNSISFSSALPSKKTGNDNDSKRLIRVSENEPPKWLKEDEVMALIRRDANFMDITDHQFPSPVQTQNADFDYPETLKYHPIVFQVFPILSIPRMQNFLREFSNYHNRYYTTATGAASSAWLLNQVSASIGSSGYSGEASVKNFTHASWLQKSVIARIEGSDPTLKNEVIVLGAHLDSINSGNPTAGLSPGADDDASGCVVLLETFRGLLESGFIPKRSIEFQFYAAEEVGLRGSQDIATTYRAEDVNVIAMLQFDVIGHFKGTRNVGLVTDYVNPALTQFLRLIIGSYLSYGWTNRTCGYGCSDHASWHAAGYPASRLREADKSSDWHTVRDTFDIVNFDQVLEYTKLAVGAIIELAEPARL